MLKYKSLECLLNFVLIERDKELDKIGSIFLPDFSKEDLWTGTVKSIGPGYYNDKGYWIETVVQVGQRCVFNRYGGYVTKVGGREYTMFQETDLLAILETEPVKVVPRKSKKAA